MTNFNCKNRRCKHIFYSSESKAVIQCPICSTKLLNRDNITIDNYIFIEAMFKNIVTYGKDETLKIIDRVYHNPLTRFKVRQFYYETITLMEA